MPDSVKQIIYRILIFKLNIPVNVINDNTNLITTYPLGELGLIKVILDIEKEFNVLIRDDQASNWVVVKDIVKCVEEEIKK